LVESHASSIGASLATAPDGTTFDSHSRSSADGRSCVTASYASPAHASRQASERYPLPSSESTRSTVIPWSQYQPTAAWPGGVGADVQMHGQIAGSPVETGGSGHVSVRHALSVLAANRWLTVESSVGEMRIRLGERALILNGGMSR
jgi:hypothetical protein